MHSQATPRPSRDQRTSTLSVKLTITRAGRPLHLGPIAAALAALTATLATLVHR